MCLTYSLVNFGGSMFSVVFFGWRVVVRVSREAASIDLRFIPIFRAVS